MSYFERRRQQLVARQKAEALESRLVYLLGYVRHWLLAMEKYHNLRNAAMTPFGGGNCSGGGGTHYYFYRLEPNGTKGSNRVECVAPRDKFPDDLLLERVINPLKKEGFKVSDPTFQRCGCATFTARPRKLAGE